jgi:hypothetical protein
MSKEDEVVTVRLPAGTLERIEKLLRAGGGASDFMSGAILQKVADAETELFNTMPKEFGVAFRKERERLMAGDPDWWGMKDEALEQVMREEWAARRAQNWAANKPLDEGNK